MPKLDGYALLRQRHDTLNADTPLFVLTSLPSDVVTEKVRGLGIERILFKGRQSPTDVVNVIRQESLME